MFQNIELFLNCELFFFAAVSLALHLRRINLHRTRHVRMFVLNAYVKDRLYGLRK